MKEVFPTVDEPNKNKFKLNSSKLSVFSLDLGIIGGSWIFTKWIWS